MPFQHVVTARFHEVDRAGIVFFGRVFEYCHAAFEELLGAAIGRRDPLEGATWAMPLVHAEADFRRPIRLGDRLAVEVVVERLGEGSVTFAFTLRGEDAVVRARAKHVHAFVEFPSFSPRMGAPSELIEALRRVGALE